MAEPISRRRVPFLSRQKEIPQIKVDTVPYFVGPKGVDYTSRLSRVENEFSVDIENVILDDGTLLIRPGTEAFDAIASNVMGLIGITSPSGAGYFFRTTMTQLQRWTGASWVTVLSGFSGGPTDYFSFAMFGNQLIIANGVNKLAYYDTLTSASGFIDQSPPARHVTSFNGRVVASYVQAGIWYPYRIAWSVKNNSFDWTGDGSGFEDLFATPGGSVDVAHGTFPLTDDTALVVRENSVWIMSVTGNVLAPHRFSRLYGDVGTRHRRSISTIPGGVMMLSHDNVVVLSTNEIQRVGERVKYRLLGSIEDLNRDAVVGRYDSIRNEYRVANQTEVWRYNFRDQGWTKDNYPFKIKDMTRVEINDLALTIDTLNLLADHIDDLPGPGIDDLAIDGSRVSGFFFVGSE